MFFNPSIRLNNALGSSTILQDATKERHIGASEYDFDNDVRIGDGTTNYHLFLNGTEFNPTPVSSNALISAQPLIVPSNGTIFTSDGLSAFECVPQADLNFKNGTLTIDHSTIYEDGSGNMSIHPNNNNLVLYGNMLINNGNGLGFNNNIDSNNMKIYHDNVLNGNWNFQNGVGSTNEFTGASAYNFDNSINVGMTGTNYQITLNGSPFVSGATGPKGDQGDTGATGPKGDQGDTGATGASGFVSNNLNNYYVSQSGNDTTGDGSIANNWKTITKAINYLQALPSGDLLATINVATGIYSETIPTITRSGISIAGACSLPALTVINSNITINMTQNSLLYSVGGLSNLQINGTIEHDNGTIYSNSLVINNIISVAPSTKSNIITQNGGAGLLGDITLQNSIIYADTNAIALAINNTSISAINTQITNNPTLTATTSSFVSVGGSGRFNAFGCSLIQTSTSASVNSLITINNNTTVTSSSTINSCILLFTAGTSAAQGAIMNFTNSASSNTCNFYNNFCKCNCSVNSPNNYIVLKSGGGAINFSQGNNLGSSSNHTIPATGAFTGWTKTTFSQVV